MTEEAFEQEVIFYQQAIVEAIVRADPSSYWDREVPDLSARFNALSQNERAYFRKLCARLLEDERYEVRLGTIKLIRSCRIKDDVLSALLIMVAFKQKALREQALFAVWRVGTRYVLPQLFWFAQRGYSSALYMIRHMLSTPEEIERGITIARTFIEADDYELREAALFLLQRYSTMEQEAQRVLAAVQKYKDELFIDALKKAPPEQVLEPLKALRSTIAKKYVQYWDVSSTLDVLEQKKSSADEQEKER